MNPLCVFFAMFAALSVVRNIIERRKRAALLRLRARPRNGRAFSLRNCQLFAAVEMVK